MKKAQPALWLILLVFSGVCGIAQTSFSNLRFLEFTVDKDSVILDSLSIVPGTVSVSSVYPQSSIPDTMYQVFPFERKIWFNQALLGEKIRVIYRVFPRFFAGSYAHKDFQKKKEQDIGYLMNPYVYKPEVSDFSALSFASLDYNGSLSRGISFGNNQDLALNSSLNLQVSGKITPEVEVLAALTDNNIPLQPEGNTQRLQEFDKIFMQVTLFKNHKITLGDFELSQQSDKFLRYYRNVQGIRYQGNIDLKKYGMITTNVSGSLARGKYALNNLVVSEGNQGPYKLTGSNGEIFIIVLAGSERVFINGVQQIRGADQDYIIDYNLGEITFNPRRVITKDLRVNVEFNYSERNYLRSTVAVEADHQIKNVRTFVHAFFEQDAKNQSSGQRLDEGQKKVLSDIGDSLQFAVYPGYRYAAFDAGRVLYKLIDSTTPAGIFFDSIFVYDFSGEGTYYDVSFSQVGQGNGNYKLSASGSNGRVYTWVAPVSGVPQGDYEPVQKLISPNEQMLIAIGSEATFKKNNFIHVEANYSRSDPNSFSKRDNPSHHGYAGSITYSNTATLPARDSTRRYVWKNTITYDYINGKFRYIERFREIPFNRSWNIPATLRRTDEHVAVFNSQFRIPELGFITYQFTNFNRVEEYLGFEHRLQTELNYKGFYIKYLAPLVHAESNTEKTLYFRPIGEVSYAIKPLKGIRLGAKMDNEWYNIRNSKTDTFLTRSHKWQEYRAFLRSPDSLNGIKASIEYVYRRENNPLQFAYDKPYFIAHTIQSLGEISVNPKHYFLWNLLFRDTRNTLQNAASTEPNQFYLGRIEYRMNELKGAVRMNIFYELGAGREARSEFTYVEAPNGYGQFAWQDLNENGIQELNEFYVSQFKDLNRFIKVFNNTNQLVAVNASTLNFVLNLNPANALRKKKSKALMFLGRFSSNHVIQSSRKVFSNKTTPIQDYFNPLPLNVSDTSLASASATFRNSIFFNRGNPKFSVEFNSLINTSKSLLTNGTESRSSLQNQCIINYTIVSTLNVRATYNNGYRNTWSQFFPDRRFEILYNEASTEWSYIWRQKLRLSADYAYSFQSNAYFETKGQFLVSHTSGAEIKYNSAKQGVVSGKFSFVSVAYNDALRKNAQVEFALLQGLQSGNNFIWNINFTRRLSENIEVTLIYDGRKTGQSTRLIHTGSALVRAMF